MRTKCSVFKIRKDMSTWYVENEFWGQKREYETDNLKNNLQLEVFDRESKPSSFIWSWIHISFLPNSCWSNRSGEKLKAKGKKNAFNKPS